MEATWTMREMTDVGGPGVRLLLVGINPGRRSAQLDRHFAGPGNRFWPALRASGLVDDPIGPAHQDRLPAFGIGITNLAPRPTATAAELTAAELRAGGEALEAKVSAWEVAAVAILGLTAYRTAFASPRATRGPVPHRPGWFVLDNPSGLNAHATVAGLAAMLRDAGHAAGLPVHPVP